jgi:hypothetical protein
LPWGGLSGDEFACAEHKWNTRRGISCFMWWGNCDDLQVI